ncbi:DUF4388 domain-containing protein [Desulfatibacillum aliphaticivorans]|nr:DUF4388 domain-containing protein [Desulfatibacillum aliphaticivorans]
MLPLVVIYEGLAYMHLKGNFETASLTTILQMLSNDMKTGLLRLTNEENDVRIFFKEGVVIYARGTAQEHALGQVLMSKGVITSDQLDECLEESSRTRQALGNILVKKGHVSLKRLKKHIADQAEQVIYSVFFWDGGRFDYSDSDLVPPGVLVTHLDIMNILLEATRRIDELDVLKKHLPGDDVVLKAVGAASADQVKLSPIEWRFLSLVDGKRKIKDITRESGYDKFTVYQVLNSLLSMGLAEKDEVLASKVEAYGPILDLYRQFWVVVRKELEKDLGSRPFIIVGTPPPASPSKRRDFIKNLHETELWKWISNILLKARPKDEAFRGVFKGIHPDNTPTETKDWVFECFKEEAPEKGARILEEGYKLYLTNLLKDLPDIIGGFRTLDVIAALTETLSKTRDKRLMLSPDQSNGIQSVFAMASQFVAEKLNDEEEKIFGLFALKNRKYLS